MKYNTRRAILNEYTTSFSYVRNAPFKISIHQYNIGHLNSAEQRTFISYILYKQQWTHLEVDIRTHEFYALTVQARM